MSKEKLTTLENFMYFFERLKDYLKDTFSKLGHTHTQSEITDLDVKSVVDVLELPETDIDENVIYRLMTGTLIESDGFYSNTCTCYCVNGLPETGEMYYDGTNIVIYFNVADQTAYGYVTDVLGSQTGAPVGWYAVDILMESTGISYSGVIYSFDEAVDEYAFYLLMEPRFYVYKDGWTLLNEKPFIKTGSETNSVVLNNYKNIASGQYAIAMGNKTEASSYGSVAMGCYSISQGENSFSVGDSTIASGQRSIAMGCYTKASGTESFAIGDHSVATGICSVAMGHYTTSSGDHSVAMGNDTTAASHYQFAHGIHNIEDTSGTYAHIVGNGEDEYNRSNAYTLDWDGNGWFAGDIYVGGAGQDEGTKLATETYVDSKPSVFYVNVHGEVGIGWVADKTYDEIHSAINDGYNVALKLDLTGTGSFSRYNLAWYTAGNSTLDVLVFVYKGSNALVEYVISDTNEISETVYTITPDSIGALPSDTFIPSVDTSLSETSTNAIENKAVTEAINTISSAAAYIDLDDNETVSIIDLLPTAEGVGF